MNVLIEARPGAGKTTALKRVAELLRGSGVTVAGFVTQEMRVRGRRVGFEIETLLRGEWGTLAHVDMPGPPRVGRYGVDLGQFERLALPALQASAQAMLIDELGKMELASAPFRTAVLKLLDRATPVAATIQTHRDPFTDELKQRRDIELVRLTHANRDRLPAWVAERILDL